MTTSKEIRKALKDNLGYNARMVSVKCPYAGKFNITIRDPKVNQKAVEALADTFETIHRCEYSGEILSGGNTFCFVDATSEVQKAWASIWINSLIKFKESIESLKENSYIYINETVSISNYRGFFQVRNGNDILGMAQDIETIALKLGRAGVAV